MPQGSRDHPQAPTATLERAERNGRAVAGAEWADVMERRRTNHSKARAIIERYGTDTLSFFKLRPDIDHLIGADGLAVAGYAVAGRTMLLAGDPVGPSASVVTLLSDVREEARRRGLRVGVLGASERGAEWLRAAGLRTTWIGEEAIIDPSAFSLRGGHMRRLRKPLHRLERLGYDVEVLRLGDVDEAQLAGFEALCARALRGRAEVSFAWAMDGLRGEHQSDCLVVVARDPTGVPRGLLHLVPSFARPALSLSLMRRDPAAPNGLMDVLVVRAIEHAAQCGMEALSLNFAAFGRWLREPSGPLDRLAGRAVHEASRFIQMESLLRFNAKFGPRWEPRYLGWSGRAGLLPVGLAAMRLEGQRPRRRSGRTHGDV